MPSRRHALTLAGAALLATLQLAVPAAAEPDSSPDSYATDARGFVDSTARCPEGQSAVAIGRTQRSLVVICTTPGDGPYEYRGVRISDGAALKSVVTTAGKTYIAETGDATYTVTPEMLSVVSGGKVIYQDTWVAYEVPEGAATGGATESGAAAGAGAG